MASNSVKWFRSFLTNRSQRVRIDDVISNLERLMSGVPQGGILSPLLYIKISAVGFLSNSMENKK